MMSMAHTGPELVQLSSRYFHQASASSTSDGYVRLDVSTMSKRKSVHGKG